MGVPSLEPGGGSQGWSWTSSKDIRTLCGFLERTCFLAKEQARAVSQSGDDGG